MDQNIHTAGGPQREVRDHLSNLSKTAEEHSKVQHLGKQNQQLPALHHTCDDSEITSGPPVGPVLIHSRGSQSVHRFFMNLQTETKVISGFWISCSVLVLIRELYLVCV